MPAACPTTPDAERASGWHGCLELAFGVRRHRTALVRRRHRGPVMVQSPFYPEGPVCHVYVLHPPGGVVGGDTIDVDVRLEDGAHALITTPAATKLYRSAGSLARVRHELHLAPGSALEWLPQETLAFSGARAHVSTRVHLCEGSRFIGWEALCLGRPACAETFSAGAVRQDLEVWRDGAPLLIERNALGAGSALLDEAFGLGGQPALATLLLHPAEEHLLPAARAVLERIEGVRAAATEVDGIVACRVIASCLLAAREALARVWGALRPRLLDREAAAPRIWAT